MFSGAGLFQYVWAVEVASKYHIKIRSKSNWEQEQKKKKKSLKRQHWKMPRAYFLWKAKSMTLNFIFFLDFALWSGEL